MKDFLKDMLIEPFTEGGWAGYLGGILMWFFTILGVGSLICFLLWLIDYSFLPYKEKQGVVTERYYVPAYTTTTYVNNGKTMTPITTYYDESYEVIIEIDGLTDRVCLYQSSWSRIKIGDKIYCKYTNGRIFRTLYIDSVFYESPSN